MNKITEIVELILKEIINTNNFDLFEKEIFEKLTNQGYETSEINMAFNYFNKRIISKNLLSLSKNNNENFIVRILSPFERARLTPAAERFLLSFIYTNKLKWKEIEKILYRLQFFDNIIDERDIKNILAEIVFENSITGRSYIN